MSNLVRIKLSNLLLDNHNPRLSEFGISDKASQEEILQILWDEMAINELMYSIVSNGFWDYEPLIILKSANPDKVVIEGNRRLAAVKFLDNPQIINRSIPAHILAKIDDEIKKGIKTLPVIEVDSREDSWKYIGFKHVNGPAKWGSFAKAKYIAEIHNDYKVPINTIAYQIGDTNNTAQKLYQGLMVMEQANDNNIYTYDDIQANRIYFSHLYTGLQREGIRNFLEIENADEESTNPVPDTKHKELGLLLEWLYGSKKNNTQSIIKSQNPDLKYLDEVLQSTEATFALKSGEQLIYAYELSRPSDSLFEEYLLSAKRNLQKARAYLTTGYKGDENLLKVAGSTANIADDLYKEMYGRHEELYGNKKDSRVSE